MCGGISNKRVHQNALSLFTAFCVIIGFAPLCAAWTDDTLTGKPVRVTHIKELRKAIATKAQLCGETLPPWTDPTITPKITPIRKVHFQELRDAILRIYQNDEVSNRALPLFRQTLTAGHTAIRAEHITELRTAIDTLSCCGDSTCDRPTETDVNCAEDCDCVYKPWQFVSCGDGTSETNNCTPGEDFMQAVSDVAGCDPKHTCEPSEACCGYSSWLNDATSCESGGCGGNRTSRREYRTTTNATYCTDTERCVPNNCCGYDGFEGTCGGGDYGYSSTEWIEVNSAILDIPTCPAIVQRVPSEDYNCCYYQEEQILCGDAVSPALGRTINNPETGVAFLSTDVVRLQIPSNATCDPRILDVKTVTEDDRCCGYSDPLPFCWGDAAFPKNQTTGLTYTTDPATGTAFAAGDYVLAELPENTACEPKFEIVNAAAQSQQVLDDFNNNIYPSPHDYCCNYNTPTASCVDDPTLILGVPVSTNDQTMLRITATPQNTACTTHTLKEYKSSNARSDISDTKDIPQTKQLFGISINLNQCCGFTHTHTCNDGDREQSNTFDPANNYCGLYQWFSWQNVTNTQSYKTENTLCCGTVTTTDVSCGGTYTINGETTTRLPVEHGKVYNFSNPACESFASITGPAYGNYDCCTYPAGTYYTGTVCGDDSRLGVWKSYYKDTTEITALIKGTSNIQYGLCPVIMVDVNSPTRAESDACCDYTDATSCDTGVRVTSRVPTVQDDGSVCPAQETRISVTTDDSCCEYAPIPAMDAGCDGSDYVTNFQESPYPLSCPDRYDSRQINSQECCNYQEAERRCGYGSPGDLNYVAPGIAVIVSTTTNPVCASVKIDPDPDPTTQWDCCQYPPQPQADFCIANVLHHNRYQPGEPSCSVVEEVIPNDPACCSFPEWTQGGCGQTGENGTVCSEDQMLLTRMPTNPTTGDPVPECQNVDGKPNITCERDGYPQCSTCQTLNATQPCTLQGNSCTAQRTCELHTEYDPDILQWSSCQQISICTAGDPTPCTAIGDPMENISQKICNECGNDWSACQCEENAEISCSLYCDQNDCTTEAADGRIECNNAIQTCAMGHWSSCGLIYSCQPDTLVACANAGMNKPGLMTCNYCGITEGACQCYEYLRTRHRCTIINPMDPAVGCLGYLSCTDGTWGSCALPSVTECTPGTTRDCTKTVFGFPVTIADGQPCGPCGQWLTSCE